MELIKYIILGILQGITEPLPISSSGHIYIFKAMFNTGLFEDLSLEIILNFASFIAILLIFRKDVLNLIKGFFKFIISKGKEYKEEFKYCMLVVIGTIPVALVGVPVNKLLEKVLVGNIYIVGIGFLITGLALAFVSNTKGNKKDKDITYLDAVIVGLFQAIALVPGISRSGLTLVGCLLCKMENKTALKYAFMLYFPVSLATMLVGIGNFQGTTDISLILYYLLGSIAAGLLTYLSYNLLTKLVEKGKLWRFSLYLFAIAIFTLMFFI